MCNTQKKSTNWKRMVFFQAKENESQTNSKADAEQQTDQGKSYFCYQT